MTDTNVTQLVINKLTKAQYDALQSKSETELYLVPDEIDNTPTSGSENPVTSDGIKTALDNKQTALTDAEFAEIFDNIDPSVPPPDVSNFVTITLLNTKLDLKENTSNKVISLSDSSTDTQYPSAKCVYDYIATQIGNINSILETI